MATKHSVRVQEALQYFAQKDTDLAFRKLLDCAADTDAMPIYEKAIALTDWKELHTDEIDTLCSKATELLMEIAQHEVPEMPTDIPVIVAKGLEKQYRSGENGNGKTTLLRILAHDLSYNAGEISYCFKQKPENDYDLRTKLAYIPQRTNKWQGSLKDNLKFTLACYGTPPEENELRTLLMIARLGLWKYKDLNWNALSSGYKMRFELARTLLRRPELLLLDEPLGNLDVLAQQVILEDLKMIANSVNHPIALILSSQQLFEVEKVSDKVIFLKNGQYRENLDTVPQEAPLIIELDVTNPREELLGVLQSLNLEKLQYNGGIYWNVILRYGIRI